MGWGRGADSALCPRLYAGPRGREVPAGIFDRGGSYATAERYVTTDGESSQQRWRFDRRVRRKDRGPCQKLRNSGGGKCWTAVANPPCWLSAHWTTEFLLPLPCLRERRQEPPKPSS